VALMALGFARLGKAIEFIPYPVTTGFTAGIAVVIATLQVKDLLGLEVAAMPDEYWERLHALWGALPTWKPQELILGLLTLGLLVAWPWVTRRVPPALVALPAAALAGVALAHWHPEWSVLTIRDKFSYVADGEARGGIPPFPPLFRWPWEQPGPGGGEFHLTAAAIQDLTLSGLTIALLGAIESLLSAVVADGIQGTRHDPDAELIAQGAGNLVAPLFGGFAATGALARTATNIRSGARSPFAAAMHALLVLGAVVAFAPWLGYLPLAAMAALLLRVAWQMSEARHFVHTLRIAPRADVILLLTCFGMTVFLDMVKAVGVGVILAAFMFMKRMADVGNVGTVRGGESHRDFEVPKGAILFSITGPLFFGSAGKATRALRQFGDDARVVILDLTSVPVLDATGLSNLEVCIERMRNRGTKVIVAGVQSEPLRTMVRAGWRHRREFLLVRRDLAHAVEDARRILGEETKA
jgi:sulfate permease, SulP family